MSDTLLESQKRILAMISDDHPLEEMLDAICRMVDAQAEGMFSSVLLLDERRFTAVTLSG
jgi:hypothetical protein